MIVAGAAIVAAILDRYGLEEVEASERDILHGAALAAAELEAHEGSAPVLLSAAYATRSPAA